MNIRYVCEKSIIATLFLALLFSTGCFKKTGDDSALEENNNSVEPMYKGVSDSYLAVSAICQPNTTVEFNYSSEKTSEKSKYVYCSDGFVNVELPVDRGTENQTFNIDIKNRHKNKTVSSSKTVRWFHDVGVFSITGITGLTESQLNNWLTAGNRQPKVNFSSSTEATSYDITIKDAAGAVTICNTETVTPPATSIQFGAGCSLTHGVTYTAYVTAHNHNLESQASNDGYTFEVDDLTPTADSITGITGLFDSETDTYLGGGLNPIANWNPFPDAFTYDVTVRNAANTATVCATVSTATTDFDFSACNLVNGTSYRLYVVGKSESGGIQTAASNNGFSFIVDTTPPGAPTVTSSPARTTDTTPTWSWASGVPAGNQTFRYELDNSGTEIEVDSVYTFTPVGALSEGDHTLEVKERDAAGNWSAVGSHTVTIDTTLPTAPTVSCTTPTVDTTPDWTWVSGGDLDSAETYRYQLDGGAWSSSTAAVSYTPGVAQALGSHTLNVQELDDAGNWSVSGSCTIVISTAPGAPTVNVTSPTSDLTPQWSWSQNVATPGDGNFRHRIDGGAWSATDTSTTFTPGSDLSLGSHTVEVQEKNADGVWSASGSATVSVVDPTEGPSCSIDQLAESNDTSPDISFSCTDNVSVSFMECQINGGAWTNPCTSPASYAGLAQAIHTFKVRGTDGDGNLSSTVTMTFRIDTTVPAQPAFYYPKANMSSPLSYFTFSWKTALDTGGTVSSAYNYQVETFSNGTCTGAADNTLTQSSGERTYTSTGLNHGDIISIRVTSIDYGGNLSLPRCSRAVTIDTSLARTVDKITGHHNHTCALIDGGVMCFGDNSYFAMAHATDTEWATPAYIAGLGAGSGVTDISSDYGNNYAVLSGGLMAWGDSYGTPTWLFAAASGVTAVASGYQHSCALVNGGVKCWGNNNFGQLGDGTTVGLGPVDVVGLGAGSGVTAIMAGYTHSCAIIGSTVKCWGSGVKGELGDGLAADSSTPVTVLGISGTISTFTAGSNITCVTSSNNDVQCWGRYVNGFGGLTQYNTATVLTDFSANSTAVAGNYDTGCAIKNGDVYCVGGNMNYQAGVDSSAHQHVPKLIQGIPTGAAQKIFSSYGVSCAIVTGGAFCWGDNQKGQAGIGQVTADPGITASLVRFP